LRVHVYRVDFLTCFSFDVENTSDILGPVEEVGASLAAKRNAKLIAASERQTEGILFYTFDFALSDDTHQLLLLCVNKGKIWSLDASTREKRYAKRKELYYNMLGSFMPKLS
jgi:photosystem II oxygen-evolving enhancer protein 2